MLRIVYQLVTIFVASILLGAAYNLFLIPDHILSGGVTGVAMILGHLLSLNTGLLMFVLNIPIFILGYLKIGKKFIAFSTFSVAITTITMQYIPERIVTLDHLLASVFGGALIGLSIGFIFRSSGSTGGFDIISLAIRKKWDIPLGFLSFTLNSAVIIISGFIFGWENALYTIVTIYVASKVIDLIHTSQLKVTLTIISTQAENIKKQLLAQISRGMTVWEAEGAFSHEKRGVILMVVTRYELTDVKNLIRKIDSHAFVNITNTIEVIGTFRRD